MKKHESNFFILQFFVPITYLVMLSLCLAFFYQFEFDTDEGINVMKAMLFSDGYELYGDIWSDQPPLFTYILSIAFQIFGVKIHVARILVLSFSCILIWGGWRFLETIGGRAYAFSGAFLIILLPHFSNLSISVMVGLPALALAMLSFSAIAFWSQKRKTFWLVVSAFFLGLSVFVKLNTFFLAPIAVIGILSSELFRNEAGSWSKKMMPPALWALTFTIVTAVFIILFVGTDNLFQLTQSHLEARHISSFKKITLHKYLDYLRPTIFLAVIGSAVLILNKKWGAFYLISWCCAAYILLLNHRPVWYHHQPLMSIPAALLAGCAVGEAVKYIPKLFKSRMIISWKGFLTVITVLGLFFLILNQVPVTYNIFHDRALRYPKKKMKNLESYKIVKKMAQYSANTRWVFTDRPMYAFRSGCLVPPEIAVLSRKRIKTGGLTEQEIFEILQKRQPEQVLLARFKWNTLETYLKQKYRVIYSWNKTKLYLRNDL